MNFLTRSRPQRGVVVAYSFHTRDSRGDADSNFHAQSEALEIGKETANLLSTVTKAYFGNSRE